MKIMTSKEREATTLVNTIVPYQHPEAIQGHVYMINFRSPARGPTGGKYYAVSDGNIVGAIRLYNLDGGGIWSNTSTFGSDNEQWIDVTDKVYLNTDELEEMSCIYERHNEIAGHFHDGVS